MFDFKSIADLRASKLFQEHAVMVIGTIDEVISNLDDMDYTLALLKSTGEAHSIRFPDFKLDNFWVSSVNRYTIQMWWTIPWINLQQLYKCIIRSCLYYIPCISPAYEDILFIGSIP